MSLTAFQEGLKWRRAVKSFVAGFVDVKPILDAIHLAPSSYGVTPYTVHVVANKAMREPLQKASYGQTQIVEATHLLYFAAHTDGKASTERFIAANQLDKYNPDYAASIRGTGASKDFVHWARAQAYIGIGFGLAAAAERRIACCPMEGFDGDAVGKIIGVPKDQKIFAVIAVGVINPDDAKANPFPKFRFPVDEVIKTYY